MPNKPKEHTWQHIINFCDNIQDELKPLIEEDNGKGIALLDYMNNAIGLKHYAIVEQQKEQSLTNVEQT